MWFDVGRTAGQQDTVQRVQQRLGIESFRQWRYYQGQGTRTINNTVDIFLADNVEWMGIELPATGSYAD